MIGQTLASIVFALSLGQTPAPFAVNDCADKFIVAVAYPSQASADVVYNGCLDKTLPDPVPEATFLSALQAEPNATRFVRVGQVQAVDGTQMIFYAMDKHDNTFWYVVHLTTAGLIFKIE